MTSIDGLWNELQAGAARRVDETHPCDLYVALDPDGRPGLVLITDAVLPTPPSLEAVAVTASRRKDGRNSLAFWLQAAPLRTAFAHLCQDLVDESRDVEPAAAGGFLLARLARWRRLLRGERGIQLTDIRGVVGELVVLSDCLNHWPASQVINGWLGPLDGAQDFVMPSLRIEAKAIQPDARVVAISSADQLALSPRTMLAVVTLVTLLEGDDGLTLEQLATDIDGRLAALGEEGGRLMFESRLAATGFADAGPYRSISFRVDELRYYEVRAGFPLFTRESLPEGVAEVRYDIELGSLQAFNTALPV